MAIPMKMDERRFKIQQLEKQLELYARMVQAYPYNAKYKHQLNRTQIQLAQLRMDRFSLLSQLEGKYIPIEFYRTVNGELFNSIEWRRVEYQAVSTQFGQIQLSLYSNDGLEELLRESMSQQEWQEMVMNQQRELQRVMG